MSTVAARVDLTNCDREPIHLSGAIQPHGVLFALDDLRDMAIARASENTPGLLEIGAAELLGRPIERVLGTANADLIRSAGEHRDIRDTNPITMRVPTARGETELDAILHRSGDQVVVELEPVAVRSYSAPHEFHRLVRSSIARFSEAGGVHGLCRAAANEVAQVTGFDRVMIYRFDPDWHGEVIAESCRAGLEPYLGLHYPAGDIPPQARAIFKANWLRFIPDVNYVPVAVISADGPLGPPLDLTWSALRSVSPLHVEYLQNMGVAATMTISILKNGELWGLVACHHYRPKMISYQLRFACEIIGRTMSLHLGSLEENEDTEYRMTLKAAEMRLFEAMSKEGDILSALAAAEHDLLFLVGATGAAIRLGDELRLVGRTPDRSDVDRIIAWLASSDTAEMFISDALPLGAPEFEPLAQTACGVLAVPLSRAKSSYMVWFRPELLASINWAGDPAKAITVSDDGMRLSPRKSFESWSQLVRLHSRRWRADEIEAAREWCRFIGALSIDRTAQLERTNSQLAVSNLELASLVRSNIELDSFAHIASHDLKEPLRGIYNYASFLIEDYGSTVGEDGREKLETLVRLSRRMELLIDSLLALSSIGRADFVGTRTDLRALIGEVLEGFAPRLAESNGSVSFVNALPTVCVDGVRLSQVFNNLFSNALKYSDGPPRIEIGVDSSRTPPSEVLARSSGLPAAGEFVTIFVRDHGIGIRQKHLTSVFQMFKRLHAGDAYGGGTGAGLAIATKIIERHGGHMWADSVLGSGTTFYFTLPMGG